MLSVSVAYTRIKWSCIGIRHTTDECDTVPATPTSSTRTRRPALLPAFSSLSQADTEDVFRRTQQPIFPAPNLQLLNNIELTAPVASDLPMIEFPFKFEPSANQSRDSRESSPRSVCDQICGTPIIPQALANDVDMCGAWLNARTQYAVADYKPLNSLASREIQGEPNSMSQDPNSNMDNLRKHSTFIQEEELERSKMDQMGTSHTSNLHADHDMSALREFDAERIGFEEAAMDSLVTEDVYDVTLDA
ncbi:unnamed protein product [Periconia digitata]|uniref:Uncharacterized protein n=1 Tax=Periconia digitata TaxID=1303443 RepID=A0A9W4XQU1_9PLEO|nr:unnamed protein product [Periconia digitata]